MQYQYNNLSIVNLSHTTECSMNPICHHENELKYKSTETLAWLL